MTTRDITKVCRSAFGTGPVPAPVVREETRKRLHAWVGGETGGEFYDFLAYSQERHRRAAENSLDSETQTRELAKAQAFGLVLTILDLPE